MNLTAELIKQEKENNKSVLEALEARVEYLRIIVANLCTDDLAALAIRTDELPDSVKKIEAHFNTINNELAKLKACIRVYINKGI